MADKVGDDKEEPPLVDVDQKLLKNFRKFKYCKSVDKVYYLEGGEWIPYGQGIQALLRKGFMERKAMIEESESEEKLTFYDLYRMTEIDALSGKGRPLSWVDSSGVRFFPVSMNDYFVIKALTLKETPAAPLPELPDGVDVEDFTNAREVLRDLLGGKGCREGEVDVSGGGPDPDFTDTDGEARYAWYGSSMHELRDVLENGFVFLRTPLPWLAGLSYPHLCFNRCTPDEEGMFGLLLVQIKVGKSFEMIEPEDESFDFTVECLVEVPEGWDSVVQRDKGEDMWYVTDCADRINPVALFSYTVEEYEERLVPLESAVQALDIFYEEGKGVSELQKVFLELKKAYWKYCYCGKHIIAQNDLWKEVREFEANEELIKLLGKLLPASASSS